MCLYLDDKYRSFTISKVTLIALDKTHSLKMTIEITPIFEEPALIVKNQKKALVIADIHLGIEWDLYCSGFSIPSRTPIILDSICEYIDMIKPDRIILLGDIKHNVPKTSWQEKDEIPHFLAILASKTHVDILPGNHDGNLELLIPVGKDIKLHSSRGAIIDGVGYFHGHTWPAVELLQTEYIVTAHNHPTLCFIDPLGDRVVKSAWIRTKLIKDILQKHYTSTDLDVIWKNPLLIIMPFLNDLCGGMPFNETSQNDFLGPIFSAKAVNIEEAQLYLLDGTKLGSLKQFRKLHGNIQKTKSKRNK